MFVNALIRPCQQSHLQTILFSDDDGNNAGLMSERDFHNNANTAAVQNKLLNATYCTLRYVSLLVLFGYIAVLGLLLQTE